MPDEHAANDHGGERTLDLTAAAGSKPMEEDIHRHGVNRHAKRALTQSR